MGEHIQFRDKVSKWLRSDFNKVSRYGVTRLQDAIRRGDVDRVQSLIEVGADPDFKGRMTTPPVQYALERGEINIVLLLIKSGADLNKTDMWENTFLHKIIEQNSYDCAFLARAALDAGADPNLKNGLGKTPLHSLKSRNAELVDKMCEKGADVNLQDDRGNTPLHDAIKQPRVALALLERGANPDIGNDIGETPYSTALREYYASNMQDVLVSMLEHGACPDARGGDGMTAAHIAAANNDKHLLSAAIRNSVNCTAQDNAGNTPLHYMATGGDDFMVRQLIAHAPKAVTIRNGEGQAPLQRLVDNAERYLRPNDGQHSVIKALLDNGADADAVSAHNGKSLMHYAASTNDLKLINMLIDHEANTETRDKEEKTALQYAIENKKLDAVDLLLDRGADPDAPNAQGWTLLDQLAREGDRDSSIVQRLITGGGVYNKQLPLNPEHCRPNSRNRNVVHIPANAQGKEKTPVRKQKPGPGA